MRMCLVVMRSLQCLPDKYGTKHGKDEGLQKGHQHLDQINEHRKSYRQRRSTPAGNRTQFAEYKNQRD